MHLSGQGMLLITIDCQHFLGNRIGADIPLEHMEKQGSSGFFHGLDHDTEFGGHRGVGLLQRVEIQDDSQDLIGDMGAGTN